MIRPGAAGALLVPVLLAHPLSLDAGPGPRGPSSAGGPFREGPGLAVDLADALVEGLTPPGFRAGASVAIEVRPQVGTELEGAGIARDLAAALRPRLESLGADATPVLARSPRGGAASDADRAESARRTGAELMLVVELDLRVDAVEAEARLLRVDAGLWRDPPSAPLALLAAARARRTRTMGESPDAARPAPEADPGPGLAVGPLVRLLRWPAPVIALAVCSTASGSPRTLVLERSALALLDLTGARPTAVARVDLSSRPRAPAPVRAPWGAVRCGRPGQAAVGLGSLAEGWTVGFGSDLVLLHPLDGFPVGSDGRGAWWRAPVEGGRPLLRPQLRGPEPFTLEAPARELVLWGSPPFGFVVDDGGVLRGVLPGGAFGPALSRAGVGLAAGPGPGGVLVASTGIDPSRERLRIGLDGRERLLAVPGPASALAFGRPRGGRFGLLVAIDAGGETDIAWAPVGNRS